MKHIFTITGIFFITLFYANTSAFGQQPDTAHPALPVMPLPVNAGFDVIIKKNGDIIYGLVKEVGLELIIYQRTDIPDGPYYTIPRVEVYAISYRNQVKDILAPVNNAVVLTPSNLPPYPDYDYKLTRARLFRNGSVNIGLGFLRSYSKVKDANQYSSSASFPIVSVGYDVIYDRSIRLGVQVALGSHKFSNQTLSLYDSTQSSTSLKENIFNIYVYGRYDILKGSTLALRPYIQAGLGLVTSHVNAETTINFLDNTEQVLLIKSGTRAAGLGIMARVGADYYLNSVLRVFLDAGVGASIINLGVAVNLK